MRSNAARLRYVQECSVALITVQSIPINICNVKISEPIVVVIVGRNSLAVSGILDSNLGRDVLHELSAHVAKHRIKILVALWLRGPCGPLSEVDVAPTVQVVINGRDSTTREFEHSLTPGQRVVSVEVNEIQANTSCVVCERDPTLSRLSNFGVTRFPVT